MKIVIIEDSRLAARMIALLVERRGWTVMGHADSAEQAMALIARDRPDAVTMDLELPGGGSLDLLAALTGALGLPVVVVSAATYEGSPAVAEALRCGADACIDKASLGRSEALCEALAIAARRPAATDRGD